MSTCCYGRLIIICGHWATGTACSWSTSGFPVIPKKHLSITATHLCVGLGGPATFAATENPMYYQAPPHPSKATFNGNVLPYIHLQLLNRFILLWFFCHVVSISLYTTPSLDTPFLGIVIRHE
jgi:hypothetical protein